MDKQSKSGQAMIEFMIGLVGIMVIVLGLVQIAQIVGADLENMFSARDSVAEDLVAGSRGINGGDLPLDPSEVYHAMQASIDSDGTYSEFKGLYPAGDHHDRLSEIWNGGDPLRSMIGSDPSPLTLDISSPFFRRSVGRSSIKIDNMVYMPPWDDLM